MPLQFFVCFAHNLTFVRSKSDSWISTFENKNLRQDYPKEFLHCKVLIFLNHYTAERREIITVRGQSYVLRLPKYWPPTPLSAPRLCTPPPLLRGEDTLARWRRGLGVNILEDARHSSVHYLYRILFAAEVLSYFDLSVHSKMWVVIHPQCCWIATLWIACTMYIVDIGLRIYSND